MDTERIDCISSYCDRWCERCRFTERCSTFASEVAIAEPDQVGPPWRTELEDVECDRRVRETRVYRLGKAFSMAAWRWTRQRYQPIRARADALLAEALEIVARDSAFIHAKLSRALDGRDRFPTGEESEDDPVQNDWNGSAKIALISIERAIEAWYTIAETASDSRAAALGDQLSELQREARREFPRAEEFVRPGFDEPWR